MPSTNAAFYSVGLNCPIKQSVVTVRHQSTFSICRTLVPWFIGAEASASVWHYLEYCKLFWTGLFNMFSICRLPTYCMQVHRRRSSEPRTCWHYSNVIERISSLFNAFIYFAFFAILMLTHIHPRPHTRATQAGHKHKALLIITSSISATDLNTYVNTPCTPTPPPPHIHTHTHRASCSPTNRKPFYIMKLHRVICYIVTRVMGTFYIKFTSGTMSKMHVCIRIYILEDIKEMSRGQ